MWENDQVIYEYAKVSNQLDVKITEHSKKLLRVGASQLASRCAGAPCHSKASIVTQFIHLYHKTIHPPSINTTCNDNKP